MSKYR